MAWTTPRTWTDGELVTAAIMNAHVRDNFNASAMHLIARKTADEPISSSTALQDDDTLTLAVLATEVWRFQFALRYEAATTGDFKMSFTVPTGGNVEASVIYPNAAGTLAWQQWDITTTDSNPQSLQGGGAGTSQIANVDGLYIGGANAGSVTLRWAQTTSDGTATKVLANSTLWAAKLA